MPCVLTRKTETGKIEVKADVGGNGRSSVFNMLEKPIKHPSADLSKQIEYLNLGEVIK
jgi:hypothetical protein